MNIERRSLAQSFIEVLLYVSEGTYLFGKSSRYANSHVLQATVWSANNVTSLLVSYRSTSLTYTLCDKFHTQMKKSNILVSRLWLFQFFLHSIFRCAKFSNTLTLIDIAQTKRGQQRRLHIKPTNETEKNPKEKQ